MAFSTSPRTMFIRSSTLSIVVPACTLPPRRRVAQAHQVHKERRTITRIANGESQEVEKEWQSLELSGYSFLTYKEYETLVLQLGSGLRKIGLTSHHKLHIFAATSVNWMAIAHACASQSLSIVTAYDTLGESGVLHTLVQTKCTTMFVDPQLLTVVTGLIKMTCVETIIVNDASMSGTGKDIADFQNTHPNIRVVTYEELRNLGENNDVEVKPGKPSDVYCIMYTSGSTGQPKGACITHEALIAGVTGLYTCVEECVSDKECVLAYLPLAHIFEMALENLVLFIGGKLGYGNPRTLTDSSVRNCFGDMRELQPTVMVGVPEIWVTVKKGVIDRLETSSPLIRAVFWGAFYCKSFVLRSRLPFANILDSIVFSRVRELTGGRLRFIMNGASGISEDTKHFLSIALAPLLAGYGLTETCACGALGNPLQYSPKAIGLIPASIEVKLVSLPDLGYFTNTEIARGEIWLKGKPVITEYYENPQETAKAITSQGWFKTGDVGEFDADGHLRVIDRVKNLVKMLGGEYIALEKLESIYRGTQIVQNVMIYADAEHSRPIAIIAPDERLRTQRAKELSIEENIMHDNSKIRKAVLNDLQATGRYAGLSNMEIVAGVAITNEAWTPDSGLVTATQKLIRKVICSRFKAAIEACLEDVS